MRRAVVLGVVAALLLGLTAGWVAHDAIHPKPVHVVIDQPTGGFGSAADNSIHVSVDGSVQTCEATILTQDGCP